jgi:hypothetical protein
VATSAGRRGLPAYTHGDEHGGAASSRRELVRKKGKRNLVCYFRCPPSLPHNESLVNTVMGSAQYISEARRPSYEPKV